MQKSKEEMAQECANTYIFRDDQAKLDIKNGFLAGYSAAQDEKAELKTELLILNKKLEQIGSSYLNAKDEIKLLRTQNKLLTEQRNAEILRGTDNHEWQIAFYDKQLSALTLETIGE